MDASTEAAVTSAAVSVVAAGIAVWQAVSARNAATSTQRQADAAEEQVTIMRAQLDADEAARLQASRPVFEVLASYVSWDDNNYPCGKLVVRQTGGVAVSSVVVEATGDYIMGFYEKEPTGFSKPGSVDSVNLGPMSVGAKAEIYIRPKWRHVTPLRVRLSLTSVTREGDLTWADQIVTELKDEPEDVKSARDKKHW